MNAVMTGVLYFLGTAFGVAGTIVGGKVLSSAVTDTPLTGVDLLSLAASDSARITAGSFLTLMMGISLVAMTIFLYPVLRKVSKELAMGMVLFRGALEGVFYFLTTITFLTLVVLGKTYVSTGSDSAVLQTLGNLLYQIESLKGPISMILFTIGGMCIYIAFYRTCLIPRWITIWGFIGMAANLTSALLNFFHMDNGIGLYLELVVAPQEILMAVWLIAKGFNRLALERLSAEQE